MWLPSRPPERGASYSDTAPGWLSQSGIRPDSRGPNPESLKRPTPRVLPSLPLDGLPACALERASALLPAWLPGLRAEQGHPRRSKGKSAPGRRMAAAGLHAPSQKAQLRNSDVSTPGRPASWELPGPSGAGSHDAALQDWRSSPFPGPSGVRIPSVQFCLLQACFGPPCVYARGAVLPYRTTQCLSGGGPLQDGWI